jgi:hypothetical protein
MAKSNLHGYSTQEVLNILTGGGGADISKPTSGTEILNAHSYVAITALTETVATVVSNDTDIWDSSALTIPAGTTIYGNWSVVVISQDDEAIVYRAYSTD